MNQQLDTNVGTASPQGTSGDKMSASRKIKINYAAAQNIKEKNFWLERLAGDLRRGIFPHDKRRSETARTLNSVVYPFPAPVASGLMERTRGKLPALHIYLCAGLALLLDGYMYDGNGDILFGVPVYKQETDDDLINGVLALRLGLTGSETVKELLVQVKQSILDGTAHKNYPLEVLPEQLDLPETGDMGFGLFDTALLVEPLHHRSYLENLGLGLVFIFRVSEGGLELEMEYDSGVYDLETIRGIGEHFALVLGGALENLDQRVGQLDILSQAQKERLLKGLNRDGESFDYPRDKTLGELFLQRAALQPDAPAVGAVGISADSDDEIMEILTYGELEEKAYCLAEELMERNVGPNDIVALMVDRSLEMLVGIVGIHIAGAAYLPIVPGSPRERVEYMLTDAGVKILLTLEKYGKEGNNELSYLASAGFTEENNILFLDHPSEPLGETNNGSASEEHHPSSKAVHDGGPGGASPLSPRRGPRRAAGGTSSSDLAYIIYTSGTTGKPKGAMLTHGNLCNLVFGLRDTVYKGYGEALKIALVAPYVFDASVKQIFMSLAFGHCLYIVPEGVAVEGNALGRFYKDNEIDVSDGTPAHLRILLESAGERDTSFGGVHFLVGGDALHRELTVRFWERFGSNGIKITNVYGPTECCVDTTFFDVPLPPGADVRDVLPIGFPMPNQQVYILGTGTKSGRLMPEGAPGEICIGGNSVGNGYLNGSQLTKEVFVPNPFVGGATLYRTGDVGRWLADGSVEYLGRTDHQVKVRGFRIELGEIESRLLNHEMVNEAVVTVRDDGGGDKYLCAYIVPTAPPDPETFSRDLRDYLGQGMPPYMIPSFFIPIEGMPLTVNGKIDRKKLPSPTEVSFGGHLYVAPRDEMESALVEIWTDLLTVTKAVGIDDNFFELGGHSLKATTFVYRVYKELGFSIEIGDVFSLPTIRELSEKMKRSEGMAYTGIGHEEEKEYYPLSYAQRRLWVLCQFEEDSTAYNMPSALEIRGDFDGDAFSRAIETLAWRHESLRTVFIMVGGDPYQTVIRDFSYGVEQEDFRDMEASEREEKARAIYRNFANAPFNLERGPLFRAKLVRMEDTRWVLMTNIHHIVNDGWSNGIIANEVVSLYNGFSEGAGNTLAPLEYQYKDYSRWHNGLIESGRFDAGRNYWRDKFSDKPNGTELPFDFPRQPIQTFNGDRVVFEIEQQVSEGLRRIAREGDATLFMGLLALLNVFLYKYTGQEDVIIGAPIAGRKYQELNHIIGFLVNTLVYRNRVAPGESFRDVLTHIKEEALTCYKYQDFPFNLLVDELGLDRDLSQSPVFNVMVAHNNTETSDRGMGMEGVTLSGYAHSGEFNMSKFDLIFFINELDRRVFINIEYNSDLFRRETVERMAENFRGLLDSVVTAPGEPVASLNLLSGAQYKRVTETFNDTLTAFPALTLQELFEKQAAEKAGKTAVVYGEDSLSYGELNEKANRLAHYLRNRYGVKPNDIIGISMDRSLDMMVAVMGILKSGAGYLAVDPTYPRERVLHVLKDSDARWLVIDKMRPELLGDYEGELIDVVGAWQEVATEGADNPDVLNERSDVLYVNYTSGSTGTPNGAMLSHDTLTNLIYWQHEKTEIDCSLRCLQFTSINFCVSFQEIMGTLTGGGELYLIGDVERQDIDYLMDFLSKNKIEILFLPFSYLNFLFNESSRWHGSLEHNLKHIITAGEQLKVTAGLKKFLDSAPWIKLHNHYGSTEMHVVTSYTLDASTAAETPVPPAGKPVSNVRIFILDEALHPVPIGVWGELCVEGSLEILGYINNRDLTETKLIACRELSDRRLYRSGDVGRWLEDGNIELRGRKDFLVKVRGFRVEPGEIESRILSMEAVRECVVVVKEDSAGQKYLVGYVVVEGIDAPGIKRFLSGQLPQYMIPQLMILDALPLMPNGKVDREKLPEPEVETEGVYVAPGDELEKQLVEIWEEVLKGKDTDTGEQTIGIDDNFFQVGGHSLKATLVASRIHKTLNKKVPLAEIFKTPTIRELARYIRESEEDRYVTLERVEKRDYYPLSSAQKRLFVLQQMDLKSTVYNMPEIIALSGSPDVAKLEKAIGGLIRRHESLRTSFALVDGEPVQRVHEAERVTFNIENYEVGAATGNRDDGDGATANVDTVIGSFIRPFDLSRPPLLRAGCLQLDDNSFFLLFDKHHIISDGFSHDILVGDFTAFYRDEEPPPLRLQYKDYVLWQERERQGENWKKQEAYWLAQFSGDIPTLELPTDSPRPLIQSFEGASLFFEVDSVGTEALKAFALENGGTLFMAVVALVDVLLWKLSGQEDVVVGTPVAGRSFGDLEKILGMFVNTLALRNAPSADKTFLSFFNEVKERSLAAFENQDYPFEELVENVAVKRDTGRNPLFDVMVTVDTFHWDNGGSGGSQGRGTDFMVPVEPLIRSDETTVSETSADDGARAYGRGTSKFDLMITATEGNGKLDFCFQYVTKLFKRETVERFSGYFKRLLSLVMAAPGAPLREHVVIGEEEQRRMLFEFNDTAVEYPRNNGVHEWFEEQVEKRPEAIALTGPSAQEPGVSLSLTYGLLNERANGLARLLVKKGVTANGIVGTMVPRSVEAIVSLLAILKAGGAYLPVDPAYPAERKRLMLADCAVKLVIGVGEGDGDETMAPGDWEFMDITAGLGGEDWGENLDIPFDENNLIYTIFTSGSTGTPKGAGVCHRGFSNLTNWYIRDFNLHSGDSTLLLTSLSFDLTQKNIFAALGVGGRLDIPAVPYFDPNEVLRSINLGKLTWICCTPSMFYKLVEEEEQLAQLSSLRVVFLGGEPISTTMLEKWFESETCVAEVVNIYGPTECTDICAFYRLTPPGEGDKGAAPRLVPTGKPIYNTALYILDRDMSLAVRGAVGEMCISGDGVGPGYVNNPLLTTEKFPVISLPGLDNGDGESMPIRVYRTGDLARWLPDGNFEYMGRMDHQVKIRGFRIELGEIENQLLKLDNVKEAVVIDRGDNDEGKYLCAYIVVEEERAEQGKELKSQLGRVLPDYMIPAFITVLREIPLTPNGKVDRKALPAPEMGGEGEFDAPRNDVEKKLADIWTDLLGIKNIGINDNFFQIGGHSLKAIQLANVLHKEFNVKLNLQDLFQAPTIAALQERIKGSDKSRFEGIEPQEKREYYEVSYSQKRMWVLNELKRGNPAFNIPHAETFGETVDEGLAQRVLDILVERHDAFRSSFMEIDGVTVQRVHPPGQVVVKPEIIDISGLEGAALDQRRVEILSEEKIKPFNLAEAPLLRVKLVRCGPKRFDMIYCMHHIISDGWSLDIMKREFLQLYMHLSSGDGTGSAEETGLTAPLKLDYKDYAAWHNVFLADEEQLKEGVGFWKRQLGASPPVLNLPYDRDKENVDMENLTTSGYRVAVREEVKGKLDVLAGKENTSLFMVLLAGFNLLLSRLTGQEDIILASPAAGRPHDDLKQIIGFFVDTLIFVNHVDKSERFGDFLRQVQENTLQVLDYQGYPLELIFGRMNMKYPEISVFFNMSTFGERNRQALTDLESRHISRVQKAKFDMVCYVTEFENAVELNLHYYKELFDPATIEKMMGLYLKILENIAESPDKRISEFAVSTKKRKIKLKR